MGDTSEYQRLPSDEEEVWSAFAETVLFRVFVKRMPHPQRRSVCPADLRSAVAPHSPPLCSRAAPSWTPPSQPPSSGRRDAHAGATHATRRTLPPHPRSAHALPRHRSVALSRRGRRCSVGPPVADRPSAARCLLTPDPPPPFREGPRGRERWGVRGDVSCRGARLAAARSLAPGPPARPQMLPVQRCGRRGGTSLLVCRTAVLERLSVELRSPPREPGSPHADLQAGRRLRKGCSFIHVYATHPHDEQGRNR
ncbi:hypothetical protein ANANG_G00124580 [Anguilla anguilla]|uniref:Uncharacterized protein n=1 Tax=Anguilla anguilla TaxID=7936 RepID=A0A9D3S1X6_ANGAN|nr:hypothetical protein ANANG_G00124580 [Anguilla anguilla]